MEVPLEVISWLRRKYPKPKVDPEWLSQCFEYVVTELNPSSMDETNRHVQTQLLASDLRDSMLPGTGAPSNIAELDNAFLAGPVLVQILAITDIGHSAFSLQTTRQTRIDKADLAGLAEAEGDSEEEDANSIPKYPRGMLRFELSDGSQTFPAIEYRRIKDLELGVTPLGYKVILSFNLALSS
ncbi:DUF1767-domain-containing protein [Sistotremastrum niveocremeum HHB9708]|uniref:RecQ-mediated genome instability protein 1 n=1 Tax=Sistotremastrum niveocremeum HHB9708 TaxID=1314777 RepID=A0A164VLW6_9AGAM|nr:DUF1767-domain-containing protein [Sistotremastrum niveocremeum HHB9708]